MGIAQIGLTVSDKARFDGGRGQNAAIVREPQIERIGMRNTVTEPKRFRHGQWITHADEHLDLRQQLSPQRQRQAVARIFPPPRFAALQATDQLPSLFAQAAQTWLILPARFGMGRTVPAATQLLQDGIVEAKK